ncbi:MAG TPA: ABC transporter ATP-binding protein [Anaeromyxobacteraceae bacterium]|nr:ABC transporter ATP-binding protein [Anaeromyxobacteraceae bacterium]
MNALEVNGVSAGYGLTQVLWDISFSVRKGQLVALIGANGAGKTTALKTICGLLRPTAGSIRYQGAVVSGKRVHQVVGLGITLVPEGRQLFPKMTVEENLRAGAYLARAKPRKARNLERVYQLFPRLKERRTQVAETMSGGEQQMLAIGRALMQDPELIMFDEPSLGLSPLLVEEIFRIIRMLHEQGLTIFLVEQNVRQTMKVADYCYVLENGRIVQEGTGPQLEADPLVRAAYLGF